MENPISKLFAQAIGLMMAFVLWVGLVLDVAIIYVAIQFRWSYWPCAFVIGTNAAFFALFGLVRLLADKAIESEADALADMRRTFMDMPRRAPAVPIVDTVIVREVKKGEG